MKRFISAVAILLVPTLLVIGPAAFAEEGDDRMPPPGGPSAPQMEQMQQMMSLMMGQMMEGMAKSMAKKEFAENVATFTRNFYEALISRGFTEEQALRIVEASGIPNYAAKR